jgi:hypothetical protein
VRASDADGILKQRALEAECCIALSGLAAGGVPGAASIDEVSVCAPWSDSDADGVAPELKGVGPLP